MVTSERYIPYAASIADLFLDRFELSSPLSQDELTVVNARSEEIWERIDREVEDTTTGEILNRMIDIVKHTLRTNIY